MDGRTGAHAQSPVELVAKHDQSPAIIPNLLLMGRIVVGKVLNIERARSRTANRKVTYFNKDEEKWVILLHN